MLLLLCADVLRRDREEFHSHIESRSNIVEETRKQLEREQISGKTIHLCFTCDPYPMDYDSTATREIIKLLKESGNHVQILTKGDGSRDFDLLDENDWYGISVTGARAEEEPYSLAPPFARMRLKRAHERGIKTWISFEPVINPDTVLWAIEKTSMYVDKIKIGKLNYYPSSIDWKNFGRRAEELCQELEVDYYIKESLRKEMKI